MTYKDILVLADTDAANDTRLDLAAALAARHQAHLAALHVSPPPYLMVVPGADVSPALIEAQDDYLREQAELTRQAVARAHQRSGQDFEWRHVKNDLREAALLHSRYADLVIAGQAAGDGDEPRAMAVLAEMMVFDSGRPVLMVPRHGRFAMVGERVLIAWKRTRESTRAVHDALPILKQAKSVVVMEINPEKNDRHIAGADIATHLARHGVKAEVSSTVADDIDAGNAILSRAADLSADLLVMGAYGHSRLREFVFGGVTLEILRHMTLPVLMSH